MPDVVRKAWRAYYDRVRKQTRRLADEVYHAVVFGKIPSDQIERETRECPSCRARCAITTRKREGHTFCWRCGLKLPDLSRTSPHVP
jgi:uncharacterized paraquat-inducible protein A